MRQIILIVLLIFTVGGSPPAATAQNMPKPQTLSDDDLQKLTEKAKKGDAGAQGKLGQLYYRGQSVPHDYAEAAKWFRKAADNGDAEAQRNLGYMYASGQGVPQDYAEAKELLQKAATQGDALAQSILGFMYADGDGVPQNYTEAAKWYRKAAEKGFGGAQFNLGRMYNVGQGVPQNFEEAYAWLSLAADQGIKDAAPVRDRVAKQLTPDNLLKAQQLSRTYSADFVSDLDWVKGTSVAYTTQAQAQNAPNSPDPPTLVQTCLETLLKSILLVIAYTAVRYLFLRKQCLPNISKDKHEAYMKASRWSVRAAILGIIGMLAGLFFQVNQLTSWGMGIAMLAGLSAGLASLAAYGGFGE